MPAVVFPLSRGRLSWILPRAPRTGDIDRYRRAASSLGPYVNYTVIGAEAPGGIRKALQAGNRSDCGLRYLVVTV